MKAVEIIEEINNCIEIGGQVIFVGEEGEEYPYKVIGAKPTNGRSSVKIEYKAHFGELRSPKNEDTYSNIFDAKNIRRSRSMYYGEDFDGEPIYLKIEKNPETKYVLFVPEQEWYDDDDDD